MKRRFVPPWFVAAPFALAAAFLAAPIAAAQSAPPAGDEEPEMTFDEDEAKKPATTPEQPGEPEPEPEPGDEAEVKLGADPTSDRTTRQTELGDSECRPCETRRSHSPRRSGREDRERRRMDERAKSRSGSASHTDTEPEGHERRSCCH